MSRPKVIVVHFGTPRVYFQVLGKVGEGRHHVALRVRALVNAPMGFNDGELVLKLDKQEHHDANSPLRVEARIIPELQRAQYHNPKECTNIAKLVFNFTGVLAVGDLIVPGDLPCTVWRFYSGGSLESLLERLADYNSVVPAVVGARVLADMLEAVRAMHVEHQDFAIVHGDEVPENVFIDYPEGAANPTFLLGDFCDGQIIREPRGSPARRRGVKDTLLNIRICIYDELRTYGGEGDEDQWNGIRDTLDNLIDEASLGSDPTALPPDDDGGKGLEASLRAAITDLRMMEDNDILMNGRSELLDRFLSLARFVSDVHSGPPMTASSEDQAVVMAKETFKLSTGWLVADTLRNNLFVADLSTVRKPPAV